MVDAGVPVALLACSVDTALNARERKSCLLRRDELLEACPPKSSRAESLREDRAVSRQSSKLMHQASMSRMSSRNDSRSRASSNNDGMSRAPTQPV
eukprot:UN4547